ncbi:MAG: 5-(carboxyamino)imidazole ribonucleotide synthase [Rickettsiales bacterium]|jgi:5-(carboxyamino)imidazole ribonucleotide synthase|nr:5-(carboxyamino)imidazole ribonucleotide synthase [Rickettsiales bacterium]
MSNISTPYRIIPTGGTIGIIGGGQLGRMTALAAANLGYKVHSFVERERDPATQVSNAITIAPFTDIAAMEKFTQSVDVVTFEFENIPHKPLQAIDGKAELCPGWQALHIAQHRIREKEFFQTHAVPTTRFVPVSDRNELIQAVQKIGRPSVLKTAEMGYDGKGQFVIKESTDLETLWNVVESTILTTNSAMKLVLEAFVDFEREISVVVARAKDGKIVPYAPSDNVHKNGILDTSTVPSTVASSIAKEAQGIACKVAEAIGFVGVMAVEFFVTREGKLLVNEMAPRPHNSGHWTMDGCVTSQFEQHVRAVCGLPLGDVTIRSRVVMQNLIGPNIAKWEEYIREPNAKLHIYGKKDAREGRKMGHVNLLKLL